VTTGSLGKPGVALLFNPFGDGETMTIGLTLTNALALSALIHECNVSSGGCVACGAELGASHIDGCAFGSLSAGIALTRERALRSGPQPVPKATVQPERPAQVSRRGGARPGSGRKPQLALTEGTKGKRGGDHLTAKGRKRLSKLMKERHTEKKKKAA
jgi:hypothetical protein